MNRIISILLGLTLALSVQAADFKEFEGKNPLVRRGVVGLYETDGKIYLEVKDRPRYIISERTIEGVREDEED